MHSIRSVIVFPLFSLLTECSLLIVGGLGLPLPLLVAGWVSVTPVVAVVAVVAMVAMVAMVAVSPGSPAWQSRLAVLSFLDGGHVASHYFSGHRRVDIAGTSVASLFPKREIIRLCSEKNYFQIEPKLRLILLIQFCIQTRCESILKSVVTTKVFAMMSIIKASPHSWLLVSNFWLLGSGKSQGRKAEQENNKILEYYNNANGC